MEPAVVYHIPALLHACIEGLNIQPAGVYVDVTFGGGGHSQAIMAQLGKEGHLYAFDQDPDAEGNVVPDSRFTFVRSNFCYLKNFMTYHGVSEVNGVMADLGVSFHHFDESQRGFSFRFSGPLDMRMNTRAKRTAADVVNEYTQEALADVLFLYGELKSARRIAAALVSARNTRPIESIDDLLSAVRPHINGKQEKKELAQLFQALRIEVNDEMSTLEKMLRQATELLPSGGRLVVLTYHSLEDRMVKNFMKSGNIAGHVEKDFFGRVNTPYRLINNRVIIPGDEEIARNPRSRSAKLRIAEKI